MKTTTITRYGPFITALILSAGSRPSISLGNELPETLAKRPNLLFIMTDQQRFDALSYAGNRVLHTPNMDRIAKEGVWFKNAHTQCAVCGPARASMLTGHSVANTGVIGNKQAYATEDSGIMPMKTYDEILAENGYTCEYYGKWHAPTFRARKYNNPVTMAGIGKTELGPGLKEAYIHHLNPLFPDRELKKGELEDTYSDRPYSPDPIDKRFSPEHTGMDTTIKVGEADIHGVTSIPAEFYISAFEAGETLQALEKLKDKPFSITCSFHHPHPPYLATEEYIKMYPSKDMVPPKNLVDDMQDSPYAHSKKSTDEKYSDPEMIQYFTAEYYALVKEVDDRVGQLLNKLDELGLTDNTLVVFVSDHGEMLGSHGLKGKTCFYEESSHVPMMLRFPGRIKPGTKVTAPVSNMDLFATLLDYMGLPPHPSDGTSLRGLIEGTVDEKAAYIVTEWLSDLQKKPSHMVLKDGWKYMRPDSSANNVQPALYNLNDDPLEMDNLLAKASSSNQYDDKFEELESCFQEWISRTTRTTSK